jgi:hypothetical protein
MPSYAPPAPPVGEPDYAPLPAGAPLPPMLAVMHRGDPFAVRWRADDGPPVADLAATDKPERRLLEYRRLWAATPEAERRGLLPPGAHVWAQNGADSAVLKLCRVQGISVAEGPHGCFVRYDVGKPKERMVPVTQLHVGVAAAVGAGAAGGAAAAAVEAMMAEG